MWKTFKIVLLAILLLAPAQLSPQEPKDKDSEGLKKKLAYAGEKEKIEILVNMAAKTYSSDPKKCVVYSHRVLDMTGPDRYPQERASALIYLGYSLWALGDWEKPFEYINKALTIYKRRNDIAGVGRALSVLGYFYRKKDFFNIALEHLINALEMCRDSGNKNRIFMALWNIGGVYLDMKEYSKAIDYYRQALEFLDRGNPKETRWLHCTHNIGLCYLYMGKFQDAQTYLENALHGFEASGDRNWIATACTNLGRVYGELDRPESALKSLAKARRLSKGVGDKLGLLDSLYQSGKTFQKLKNYGQAKVFYDQSLKIIETLNDKSSLEPLYKSYSELYSATGDCKKALDYHEKYSQVRDHLFEQTKNRQLAELEIQFEAEEKTRAIEILTRDNKIQKLTRNMVTGGLILVTAILLLLFKKYLHLFSFWKKQKYIGQYRLMDTIGSGGMGSVYLAHTVRDKKQVAAVKVLLEELVEDKGSRRRFEHEGAIIDRLDHPNIVKTFERGEYKGRLYIAMEYLRGRTLAQKIHEEDSIPLHRCLRIMEQVADALAFIHGKNIMHRDLKPANIMLVEQDENPDFVKLLDFGVALIEAQTRLTQSGMLVGTIHYTAPEQITGSSYTTAGDVYAMGVTFYELLAGKPLFPQDAITALVEKILAEIPPAPGQLRPGTPGELNDLIMAMLAKEPGKRPPAACVFTTLKKMKRFM